MNQITNTENSANFKLDLSAIPAYRLVRHEALTDIHSDGYLLEHVKTGAKVMLIANDDNNKVFNIAFRTTPTDSTGVAHIIEHSVLCGSKDFPVKDPFVELVKGSLNTFLNAMTYPDKTCYPVASCNDQDFQNLMYIYLDAVFHPNIYQKEQIFRQEGWNYHLENVDGPLTYNGVVYNEMKGAFSSPDEVLEREIMNALFPDTTYGCESGGDPKNIPDLTYEQFLAFHQKYYHPSNSYIYLYGDMDMVEKLQFIDEKYLSNYDALKVDSEIHSQIGFSEIKELESDYPISDGESEEDNTYLAYNMVVGETADQMKCMAFEILDYVLLSTPGAPLKQALLDAQIAEDIYGSFDDGIKQPYFTVIAKGANKKDKETFVSIIRNTLQEIVEKGIDRKAIEAGINFYEFRYREADFTGYPKGLIYGLDIMGEWLYDVPNPFAQVQQVQMFEQLKKAVEEGYFEKLIQEYLLDNTHGCVLILNPKKGLAAQREKALEEKLESYLQSLSAEERQRMVEETAALEAYQAAEDDPETLKCIPMLKREDISREALKLHNTPSEVEDRLFLHHNITSNGIGYVSLLFELNDLTVEKTHYLGLLKAVLGVVDTEHYTYGELFNTINSKTGGISFGIEVFDNLDDSDKYRVMFGVQGKALYAQMNFMFEMIREMVTTSKLDDKKRLREIISHIKSRAQANLVSSGHATAVLRASSYGCGMAAFQEELAGIGFYRFIEELDREFDSKFDEAIAYMKSLIGKVFRRENFAISYTGEAESVENVKECVSGFLSDLDKMNECNASSSKKVSEEMVSDAENPIFCTNKNEAFKTSGQVQYAAQCGNFLKKGYPYTGALGILKVALNYDYLWIEIRVKGGAYGCMSSFRRNGETSFASYRDPHLMETYDVFAGIPNYVANFKADEDTMTKYIIGTISGLDTPLTPRAHGNVSKIAYFRGLTEEMLQTERNQILDATVEDIRNLAPLIQAALDDDQKCVVGSESAIEKVKENFKVVTSLING